MVETYYFLKYILMSSLRKHNSMFIITWPADTLTLTLVFVAIPSFFVTTHPAVAKLVSHMTDYSASDFKICSVAEGLMKYTVTLLEKLGLGETT